MNLLIGRSLRAYQIDLSMIDRLKAVMMGNQSAHVNQAEKISNDLLSLIFGSSN